MCTHYDIVCVQAQGELKAAVLSLERERDGLHERLAADKETHCGLEQELQTKQARWGLPSFLGGERAAAGPLRMSA